MNKEMNIGQFLIALAIFLLALSIIISALLLIGKIEEVINVSLQIIEQI